MSSDASSAPDEAVLVAERVSKIFTRYRRPSDRLRHLLMPWRCYPTFDALNDVSFTVNRGETIGIVGQNGAGKSTLLQIVTGTLAPSAGDVQIVGRIAALLELGAGFEPDFTGRENVYLNGTILGLSEAQLDQRLDAIIAFSELGDFIDEPVRTYSSGMFMRLAFSVAAHVDADLLIIDEALAVGDVRFNQKCMRFLKDFKARGSILFVSHDLGAVTALCDQAIWLDHGCVKAEGDAGRICEQYLESLFRDDPPDDEAPSNSLHETAPFDAAGETILFGGDGTPTLTAPGTTSCSPFNPDANGFGVGGAEIVDAGLYDAGGGNHLSLVQDGQSVDLRIAIHATERVERPIVGFYIKDRLGQNLLGDNTFSESATLGAVQSGERATIRFRFRWPALAIGSYALTLAIADGVMEDHIQRHWLHDAVIFDVLSSAARHGLVGLEISLVSIERDRMGIGPPNAE